MFLTPKLAAVLIAIKLTLGIMVGMVAAFIFHRLRPVSRHWLLTGAGFGVASFLVGSFLTGWASDRTSYVNGHATTWRTWFADQEFSFPLLLTLCLVGLHHLWLTAHRSGT